MVKKSSKRLTITFDKDTYKIIEYYFKEYPDYSKSLIVCAMLQEFNNCNCCIGYNDLIQISR